MTTKLKITLLALSAIFMVSACKKKIEDVSMVVTASYPTITITGSQFYSIPVGGTLPSVSATAFDSTLKESCTTSLDASGLDNSTPGIYFVPINSKNHLGYKSSLNVLVAVTNVADSINISGTYTRTATGVAVQVNEVKNGLYSVDNLFGAASTPNTYAYFVMVDDSTMIMPDQPTSVGDLSTSNHFLHTLPADTSYGYKITSNITSNRVLRVFQKN